MLDPGLSGALAEPYASGGYSKEGAAAIDREPWFLLRLVENRYSNGATYDGYTIFGAIKPSDDRVDYSWLQSP